MATNGIKSKSEEQERDRFLTAAIKAGKFSRSQKNRYEAMWAKDPKGTRELINLLATGLTESDKAALERGGSVTAAALPRDGEPTLFPEGDLPSWTASGIDPKELLMVPWQARRAMARASREEAYRIRERYSGEDGAYFAAREFADDANDFKSEVSRWVLDQTMSQQLSPMEEEALYERYIKKIPAESPKQPLDARYGTDSRLQARRRGVKP